MMLDAQADPGRQVWLPCPHCVNDSGANDSGVNDSGLYLLGSEANWVWVQCGKCLRRWWHDTGCGHGKGPLNLSDVA